MTAPGELKTMTLRELRAARKDMMSAAWKIVLQSQPIERRREAALRLADIEQAILSLGNADLAAIRDKLAANEADLLAGTAALAKARQNLTRVQTLLDAAGRVLVTVAKIAKFVATGL